MHAQTHNGDSFRILNVLDEYTRACLDVRVARRLTHREVLEVLADLYVHRGVPVHIRSDNGSEFTESFNGRMRDEFLNGEIFYTLKEAQILIEMWRKEYNTIRPHSSLGYRPPAPAAIVVQSTQLQSVGLTL